MTALDLATLLADRLEDAQALRRHGEPEKADLIDRLVADVKASAEDWLVWLSESDAQLRSGERESWFRRNRARLADMGHAGRRGRVWYYRQAVIPQRKHLAQAREDARREAQGDAAA